jgi:hypothetical protein
MAAHTFRVVARVFAPTLGAGVPPDLAVLGSGVLSRADSLASLTVLDEKGTEVALASLWRDRTAVLALVRHFG